MAFRCVSGLSRSSYNLIAVVADERPILAVSAAIRYTCVAVIAGNRGQIADGRPVFAIFAKVLRIGLGISEMRFLDRPICWPLLSTSRIICPIMHQNPTEAER